MLVPGTRIRIADAELEVYLYGDASAGARDIDRFYTLSPTASGEGVRWSKPSALVAANNLVIIVRNASEAVREQVRSAVDGSHVYSPASRNVARP